MATLASTYNTRRLSSRAVTWEVEQPVRERDAADGESSKRPRSEASARPVRLPAKPTDYRPALYRSLSILNRGINWTCRTVAGLFLFAFALQFPHPEKWDGTWAVLQVHSWTDPILGTVASWVGTEWGHPTSTSFLPLGLVLLVGIVKISMTAGLAPALRALRPAANRTKKSGAGEMAVDEAGMAAPVDSERSREQLLKRYREIEGALKSVERKRCSFLSIDIAGSTKMKENEQAMAIDVTFQAYMNMLDDIFQRYGAWKSAWTPDGVMVCFLHVDVAVAAAQSVLRRLRQFNRTENLLKSRISVRCGLDVGELSIFEDTKLEKIAHPALDVTGQMQKHASLDTLWLSAKVYEHLDDKAGFKPAAKEVDGLQAYEWSARLSPPEREPLVLPLPKAKGTRDSEATWA